MARCLLVLANVEVHNAFILTHHLSAKRSGLLGLFHELEVTLVALTNKLINLLSKCRISMLLGLTHYSIFFIHSLLSMKQVAQ